MNEQTDKGTWIWIGVILLMVLIRSGGCTLPNIIAPENVVAGTYYYEQRTGDPTPEVTKAIDKLNARDITADMQDIDAVVENGKVKKQYEITYPEAKKAGVPVWVTRSETKVLSVVKDPKTEEDILETAP